MKAKDQRMCISPYLRDEAFDQSGLKIRTRQKSKRMSRPFVDIYVGEFRKIFSKKAPIPRRHAPSLGTFSSKKMVRCKYYQECLCRGALCRNCDLACRFLPPVRDRSLWVANFEYSSPYDVWLRGQGKIKPRNKGSLAVVEWGCCRFLRIEGFSDTLA